MNPEEGTLRPQILDRLGLRVWVAPLDDRAQRLEVYRRVRAFREDPEAFRTRYAGELARLRQEVVAAREILPHVTIAPEAEEFALGCIQALNIPSHRAEITMLEAARARVAADYRTLVTIEDVRIIAPLALRQRRSSRLEAYAQEVAVEEGAIDAALAQVGAANASGRAPTRRKRAPKKKIEDRG
jgi:magnesium chelatase subunit I